MSSSRFFIAIALPANHRFRLCAVTLAGVLTIANAPPTTTFNQRVLAAQNTTREELRLPALQWDSTLTAMATGRANQLAAAHTLEHALDNALSPQGENIWGGTRNYYSPEAMINAWADEKQYFKPGVFPNNSTTGNVDDVGHFTQLAWKKTTKVGCAVAHGTVFDILVCRYSPAGNAEGERPF